MKFINFLKNNNYSTNTIRTYKSILLLYKYDLQDIRLIRKRLLSYTNSNTVCTHYNVLLSYMKFTKDKRINELKKINLSKHNFNDEFSLIIKLAKTRKTMEILKTKIINLLVK